MISTPVKTKKPKKKKAKVSSGNSSKIAHTNCKTRPPSLSLTTPMSLSRKYKVPKLNKIQWKWNGIFHSGHLTRPLTKRSMCGNGHAGIVCEYFKLYHKPISYLTKIPENIGVLPIRLDAQSTRRRWWSSLHPAISLRIQWAARVLSISTTGSTGLQYQSCHLSIQQ